MSTITDSRRVDEACDLFRHTIEAMRLSHGEAFEASRDIFLTIMAMNSSILLGRSDLQPEIRAMAARALTRSVAEVFDEASKFAAVNPPADRTKVH